MVALILFIAFGLLFGYFATLNTGLVTVYFGTATINSIPLYILVLASFGIGVVFTSLFYTIKFVGNKFALRKKEGVVARAEKEIAELNKRVHKLELENTKLKVKTGEESEDDDSL